MCSDLLQGTTPVAFSRLHMHVLLKSLNSFADLLVGTSVGLVRPAKYLLPLLVAFVPSVHDQSVI
jgi:hypothetical protein